MKKWGKTYGWIVLVLLAIFLVFFIKEQNYAYENSGYIEKPEYVENEKGEVQTTCLTMPLTKGTYKFSFSYEAKGDKAWALIDENQNSGTNQRGKVIVSGTLPAKEQQMETTFTLEEDTDLLSLILYSEAWEIKPGKWDVRLLKDISADWIVLSLVTAAVFWAFCTLIRKPNKNMLIVLGLGILLTVPFFGDFLQQGHDLDFHLSRIAGIAEGLREGQFPVRMNAVMNKGFGSFDLIYYPNLFLYPAALLSLFGCSLINAYKILVLGINIATGLIGYYCFRKLLRSEKLGMVCAVLYLLNPYRLLNLYLRAAVGELLAAVFLPLLLYGVYELLYGKKKNWWFVVLGATGIMQSHILSLELSLVFLVAFAVTQIKYLCSKEGRVRFIGIGKALLCIVMANLWFILPFIMQFGRKLAITEWPLDLQGNAVSLSQMFSAGTVMAGGNITDGVTGEMPLTIGIIMLLGAVIYVWFAFVQKTIAGYLYKLGNICFGFGIFFCYMASDWFPWEAVQNNKIGEALLGNLQYPWRILAFAALCLTITTGIAVGELYRNRHMFLIYFMGGMTFFMGIAAANSYTSYGTVALKTRNQALQVACYADYYEPDFDTSLFWGERNHVLVEGAANITAFERKTSDLYVNFSGAHVGTTNILHLPLYNYDVYEIYLDGVPLDYYADNNHMVTVKLPKETQSGELYAKYVSRKLYLVSDMISLVFLLGTLVLFIRNRSLRFRNRNKQNLS